MAIKLWKKIPLNIRRWIIGVMFWIVSIISAFAIGTMYPNKWVLAEFQNNITHKIQEEWKEYGFFEPEMIYTDNQSFIQAVNKCISCLLYTSPSPRDRQKSRMPSSA